MAERKRSTGQPKQETPKGHEIPVPKREDFLRDLKKVAPPVKEPGAPKRKDHEP